MKGTKCTTLDCYSSVKHNKHPHEFKRPPCSHRPHPYSICHSTLALCAVNTVSHIALSQHISFCPPFSILPWLSHNLSLIFLLKDEDGSQHQLIQLFILSKHLTKLCTWYACTRTEQQQQQQQGDLISPHEEPILNWPGTYQYKVLTLFYFCLPA